MKWIHFLLSFCCGLEVEPLPPLFFPLLLFFLNNISSIINVNISCETRSSFLFGFVAAPPPLSLFLLSYARTHTHTHTHTHTPVLDSWPHRADIRSEVIPERIGVKLLSEIPSLSHTHTPSCLSYPTCQRAGGFFFSFLNFQNKSKQLYIYIYI